MKQTIKELSEVFTSVLVASAQVKEIKEYEELSNKPVSEMTMAMIERRQAIKEKYEL